MNDIIIGLAKSCIKSVFTAEKYDNEILDEDSRRIMFIRNLIEESLDFIKNHYKDLDFLLFSNELKQYALELFIKQCIENISTEEKLENDFNIQEEKDEITEYFDYIYLHLKYPNS
ncbi:MAG: hypothetical protein K8S23_01145 [Candidatus Cloacimonetes bacterium]|nr:hypothetical protein [Candidatus Cloacimonadota bacterium]